MINKDIKKNNLDVLIIGAGLSGLVAALKCQENGLNIRVLEAGSRVGGRVQSEKIKGAICDRGFQVFLPAYSTASKLLNGLNLEWYHYPRSASILCNTHYYFGMPFSSGLVTNFTKRFPMLFLDYLSLSKDVINGFRFNHLEAANQSTMSYIKSHYSDFFSKNFLIPFFQAVFLDPNLTASYNLFQYYLNLFFRKGVAIPKFGMGEISTALFRLLNHNTVELNSTVDTIFQTDSIWNVYLKNGKQYRAKALVIATSNVEASKLLNHTLQPQTTASLSTHYFLAETLDNRLSALSLFPKARFCHHLAIPTLVNPHYTDSHHHLVMASTYGSVEVTHADIKTDLQRVGLTSCESWQHIHHLYLPYTLPSQCKQVYPSQPGLFLTGDYQTFASIEGACISGTETADHVNAYLDGY